MVRQTQHVFIHSPELEQYSYPPYVPFDVSRAGRVRRLLQSFGALTGPDRKEVAPEAASRPVLERANGGYLPSHLMQMGLGTMDCPVFAGMYDYAVLAAGATLTGARLVLHGEAPVTFNPSGGYHHAGPELAAGFCYINDVVLGCLELAAHERRVAVIDLDVHHGDGVQAAFYHRNDVMTISLHESGETLFPGSGFVNEIGEGPGLGYSVNVPLPVGIYDGAYLRVFREVVVPLVSEYDPDVVMVEVGADGLAGDPLAHLKLTNNVYADILKQVRSWGKPIVAVGGGGYHVENTVRAWALAWTVLCGDELRDEASAGLGGVLLESTEWQGGLRDRVLVPSADQVRLIEPVVERIIAEVKRAVFSLHHLS